MRAKSRSPAKRRNPQASRQSFQVSRAFGSRLRVSGLRHHRLQGYLHGGHGISVSRECYLLGIPCRVKVGFREAGPRARVYLQRSGSQNPLGQLEPQSTKDLGVSRCCLCLPILSPVLKMSQAVLASQTVLRAARAVLWIVSRRFFEFVAFRGARQTMLKQERISRARRRKHTTYMSVCTYVYILDTYILLYIYVGICIHIYTYSYL